MFDVKIIVSIVIALLGWIIGHLFNSWRDIKIKRREICLQNLINAYRILTCEISEREPSPERKTKLENIIADIQLFGSIEQIELAKSLAKDISSNNTIIFDPLINCLRDDLRKQLKLTHVEGNVRWLRYEK